MKTKFETKMSTSMRELLLSALVAVGSTVIIMGVMCGLVMWVAHKYPYEETCVNNMAPPKTLVCDCTGNEKKVDEASRFFDESEIE
jgi:hypothetical protein